MNINTIKKVAALLTVICGLTLNLHAVDTNWTNTGAGDWFNTSNWDNGLPTASRDVYIINGGTALLSFGSASAFKVYAGWGGAGNLIVSGSGYLESNQGIEISNNSSLTITDNATVKAYNLNCVSTAAPLTISGNGYLDLGSTFEVQSILNYAITGTAPRIKATGRASCYSGTLNVIFSDQGAAEIFKASAFAQPLTIITTGGIRDNFDFFTGTSDADYVRYRSITDDGDNYFAEFGLSWTDTVNPSGTFTVGGAFEMDIPLADNGSVNSLVKEGDGTLILSAINTYTGATTVNSGTLIYNQTGNQTAILSGTGGTIIQQSTGTLALTQSGSYGGTLINNTDFSLGGENQTIHTLINNGNVHFINLGKTLTLTNLGGSGVFHMDTDLVAGTADFINVTGSATGSHTLRLTNSGADPDGQPFRVEVVRIASGDATFTGTVSVGMFNATVQQDGNVWYLENIINTGSTPPVNPPVNPPASEVGEDILADQPSQSQSWFDNTANIATHLGDLRVTASVTGARERRPLGGGILDAVWIKSYGQQVNISGRVVGASFREYQYGVDAGTDHRWTLDKNNTLIAGAFVGYGSLDRTLRNGLQNDGSTDNYHFGVYGIWLHDSGLYADFIAKGQYADHEVNAWDASNNHTTADYNNWGGGVTLDIGKQFKFKDGWYAEPSLSAGYAHFTGETYTANSTSPFTVTISDADVFQFKLGVQFGRTIALSNGGILQPYIKVAGVEQASTGGKLRASGAEWRPTLDGASAEIGGGVIWQLNTQHSLTLDYEASFGGKYDKPWGLTAGYRYQF